MKKIVIFTGAGVSADSGIATFRDSDGLWANHKIEDVCTPQALQTNRPKVIDFYNTRRKELLSKHPNAGHQAIIRLLEKYEVEIVTQNIDDLHERAATEANAQLKVTHLHGELRKLRSSTNESALTPIDGWEQKLDDKHSDGSLLRPFVVFFGEGVPMFEECVEIVATADIFIVVGTSLAVYPAASLVNYIKKDAVVYVVDPNDINIKNRSNNISHIQMRSVEGLPLLVDKLLNGGY